MSHTTRIKTLTIADAATLERAVAILQRWNVNCSLERDVAPRMYYRDQHGPCPYVLRLHDGEHDVGFERQDGAFALVFDDFLGRVSKRIGNPQAKTELGRVAGKLLQAYALAALSRAAAANGYTVLEERRDQDQVHLVLGV